MFKFRIIEVKSGWFDVSISNEYKTIEITNSWYLGNDAQKIFLRNLNELYYVNDTRWLCLHDEPGAVVWRLEKHNDIIKYKISSTMKSSDEIACFEGTNILGNFEGSQLANEEIYSVDIEGEENFINFYKNVIPEFGSADSFV